MPRNVGKLGSTYIIFQMNKLGVLNGGQIFSKTKTKQYNNDGTYETITVEMCIKCKYKLVPIW